MSAAPGLLIAASLGSALVAGIFFAFSTFVLQALDRLPPEDAAAAMRAINVTVINPLFFAAFFGTAGLAVAAVAFHWEQPTVLAGAACYLLGTIGVTIAGNVPLNERLARDALDWSGYRRPWGRWNHVRTAAALAAAVLFLI